MGKQDGAWFQPDGFFKPIETFTIAVIVILYIRKQLKELKYMSRHLGISLEQSFLQVLSSSNLQNHQHGHWLDWARCVFTSVCVVLSSTDSKDPEEVTITQDVLHPENNGSEYPAGELKWAHGGFRASLASSMGKEEREETASLYNSRDSCEQNLSFSSSCLYQFPHTFLKHFLKHPDFI